MPGPMHLRQAPTHVQRPCLFGCAGDPDAWEAMLATNTLGPMRLSRHLAPAMAQRGGGLIITTGSLAGTFASASSAPYCASKWGIRGWVLGMYEVRLQGRCEGWKGPSAGCRATAWQGVKGCAAGAEWSADRTWP